MHYRITDPNQEMLVQQVLQILALVELAMSEGGIEVGVAAFPDGHPGSNGDFKQDIETLIRKEECGATFATTQFFFEVEAYEKLVTALRARGSQLPIIAGILPITNGKQLTRMAELSGTPIPDDIRQRVTDLGDDAAGIRAFGIERASQLSEELLALGVPGLHFYTMNTAASTLEVARNIGFDRRG